MRQGLPYISSLNPSPHLTYPTSPHTHTHGRISLSAEDALNARDLEVQKKSAEVNTARMIHMKQWQAEYTKQQQVRRKHNANQHHTPYSLPQLHCFTPRYTSVQLRHCIALVASSRIPSLLLLRVRVRHQLSVAPEYDYILGVSLTCIVTAISFLSSLIPSFPPSFLSNFLSSPTFLSIFPSLPQPLPRLPSW